MTVGMLLRSTVAALLFHAGAVYAQGEYRLEAESEPAVEDSRDNLSIVADERNGNLEKTPADCLAAAIAVKDRRVEWQPKWHYYGIGGPRLSDFRISPDRSLYGIVENTGVPEGASGSRIVLINTWNWKVVRIFEFPKRKISRFRFIPNSSFICCFQEKQPCFKQPSGLLQFDTAADKVTGEYAPFPPVADAVCDREGKKLYVKTVTDDKLYIFDPRRLDQKPREITTSFTGGVLAVADNGDIIAAGKEKLLVADAENFIKYQMPLPSGFTPSAILMTGNPDEFVIAESGGRVMRVSDRAVVQVTPLDVGGAVCLDASAPGMVVAQIKNDALSFVNFNDLTEKSVIFPNRLKPLTGGTAADIFCRLQKTSGLEVKTKSRKTKSANASFRQILLLDRHGNLILLTETGQKWRKEILVSPKK